MGLASFALHRLTTTSNHLEPSNLQTPEATSNHTKPHQTLEHLKPHQTIKPQYTTTKGSLVLLLGAALFVVIRRELAGPCDVKLHVLKRFSRVGDIRRRFLFYTKPQRKVQHETKFGCGQTQKLRLWSSKLCSLKSP